MILNIMEIEYFFVVLKLNKVEYFVLFCFIYIYIYTQNFYLFHLQLLVIVVSTKLSTVSGFEKVHVQVTGVAVS